MILLLVAQALFTSEVAEPADLGIELDGMTVRSVKGGSTSGLQPKDVILGFKAWAELVEDLRRRPVDIEFPLQIRRKELTRDIVVRLVAPRKVENDERLVALRTTTVKVGAREYELLAPKGGDKRPLLVLLHGTHSSPFYILAHWAPLAKGEAVIAAPKSKDGLWDAAGADGDFVKAVVDDVSKKHAIDPSRVWVAGHSSGGMFASYLASKRGDLFAAAGCFASHLLWEPAAPSKRPAPILLYLGEKDKLGAPEDRSAHAPTLRKAGHALTVLVEKGGARGPDFHDLNDRGCGVIWEWLKRQKLSER